MLQLTGNDAALQGMELCCSIQLPHTRSNLVQLKYSNPLHLHSGVIEALVPSAQVKSC